MRGQLAIQNDLKMYYYYDSGELRGPFSIHELQSQVNGDELVRNESNHWQAAQDIEGWDEAVEEFVPLESEEPIETMAISTENLIENESTEIPEVGGIRIEADEPDEFNYEKPSKFWRYFSYNDEYITGGTYIGRLILQSMTIPLLGLGFYLIIITFYKRARSLGMDGGAGIVAGIMGVNLIGNYVNGFNAQPTYNSYYSSEPEMSGPALFLWVLSFFLHWWLTLRNSRAVMLGGPRALLSRLGIHSQSHREDLIRLLNLETTFRERCGIPPEMMVVPVRIPEGQAEEYQDFFGSTYYYLACRDSTRYYGLPEVSKLKDSKKLLKRSEHIDREYEEFKALVAFK